MTYQVSAEQFNAYIKQVQKTHKVYENLSIHHGENDTAYQITFNNEWVTIGRFDPPNDYLVFDYLNIYKQNDKINTTKRQNDKTAKCKCQLNLTG